MSMACYNAAGQAVPDLPVGERMAVEVQFDQHEHCYVRADAEGFLFDPTDPSHRLGQKDRDRGGKRFSIRRCGRGCFDAYLAFLRGRNRAWFTQAQRGFANG